MQSTEGNSGAIICGQEQGPIQAGRVCAKPIYCVCEIRQVEGQAMQAHMSTRKKLIMLKSSDGRLYAVDESTMLLPMSFVRDHTTETLGSFKIIDVAVPGEILIMVFQYCAVQSRHGGHGGRDSVPGAAPAAALQAEIKAWEARFVQDVDLKTLDGLLEAAYALNVTSLIDLISLVKANRIFSGLVDRMKARLTS